MFCKNCGTEINDGSKFCPICGAAMQTQEKSENVPVNEAKTEPLQEAVTDSVTDAAAVTENVINESAQAVGNEASNVAEKLNHSYQYRCKIQNPKKAHKFELSFYTFYKKKFILHAI